MPYKRHLALLFFLLISAASFSSKADDSVSVIDECSQELQVNKEDSKRVNSLDLFQEKILEIHREKI
ncbi:hypothetical protein [Halobacteriovorax sp. JY17]|uniref:hypothetical protein n=1 Tax=Halobacteriovorax sp. JY17 TaxID=2014617 RepID=UPI000C5283DC|nr:hypothetical protein [Halobacteriovorax sp. JY17]PIK14855.1 MAG: hypothetical protein CES88_11000 [Halobacteriovorax sp. JY17]